MGIEKKVSGKFLRGTGIFKGINVPIKYQGQYVVIANGKMYHNTDFKAAFSEYEKDRITKQENSTPVILRIPTEEESKAIHVFYAA